MSPLDARHARTMILTGIVASLLTMLFHPTGQSVLADAQAGGHNAVARGTHLLAIVAQPLLLAGMGVLSWQLRARPALAGLGFLAYLVAAVALMIAAVMSGVVAPRLAEILVAVSAGDRQLVMQQWYLSHTYNQAFAQVAVLLTGVAILSWSAAMRASAAFPKGLTLFGVVIGVVGFLGGFFNAFPLDIHRFGLIVLVQSAWMLWASRQLGRE